MTTFILIFVAIVVLGVVFGASIRFIFRRFQSQPSPGATPTEDKDRIPFRLSYIAAPLAILVFSLAMTIWFSQHLPGQVGYGFRSDGTPDKWFSREMALALMLFPQVFLTVFAAGLTWSITRLNVLSAQTEVLGLRPTTLLQLMGNIAVLPQVVLGFVMIDIFSYNAYQIHILPPTAFFAILGAVTAAMVGGLLIFVLRVRKKPVYQPEE